MANIVRQDEWDEMSGMGGTRGVGRVWVGRVVGLRPPGFGKMLPGKRQQTEGGKSLAGSEDHRGF